MNAFKALAAIAYLTGLGLGLRWVFHRLPGGAKYRTPESRADERLIRTLWNLDTCDPRKEQQ